MDEGLARYIEAVRAIPELSREDEVRVARRWVRRGDRKAGESLLRANLRHVVSIASTYRRYGLPLGELVAEGNFGIVHALRKFDPSRGTRFVTYAAYWIRAYMINFVIRSWSLVGVGSGPLRSKIFFRLRRERARIASLVGEGEEADQRLARSLGAPVEKVRAMTRRLEARDVSLDSRPYDQDGPALVDLLTSDQPSQEDTVARGEETALLRARVREAISDLDARERYIVERRVMADGGDELSLAEIGRQLGVSRERARQLESRAKRKLRAGLSGLERAA